MEEYAIVSQHTQRFIDSNLRPFSPVYLSSEDFKQVNKLNIDAIVVGSDQVWRPGYMDNIEDYFLANIDNHIRKYSYAASLGVSEWIFPKKQTDACRNYVKDFIKTSVRERSSIDLCKKHLGITPEFVLDPTLLFDKSFYQQYIEEHNEKREGKMCVFVLDKNSDKKLLIDRLTEYLGKDYYYAANNTEDRSSPLETRIAPSVSSWLDAFNSADCIFTDSFHGCVFSIIFEKDFYVYVNKERGVERFHSLLGLLGLENRIVDLSTKLSEMAPIEWNDVAFKLEVMRKSSYHYLSLIKN